MTGSESHHLTLYHPAFAGVVQAEALEVPDDPDLQVQATIELMSRYASEDACSPEVRELASRITAGAREQSEKAARIWDYVRHSVYFAHDEVLANPLLPLVSSRTPIVEILIRPRDLISMCSSGACRRMADCDDYSMLVASLLLACGIRAAFVTVAADPQDLTRFSHVYVAAYTDSGDRIPLDASHGKYPGWEVRNVGRRREWPLDGGSSWAAWALFTLATGVTLWVFR